MTERLASLDLLRGLAAWTVAISHFFYFRSGAHGFEAISIAAVEVFFVLSGFVLAPQIMLILESGKLRDLGVFLARRWMRTIPAYIVALLLISALLGTVGTTDFWRYLFYIQNLAGQHNAYDYYPVSWSLSVEEWFYVAFPAFLLLASIGRARNTRYYALATVTFIIAITATRTAFGDVDAWGPSVRRVVIFRLDSIAFGFVLFLALRDRATRGTILIFTLAATTAVMAGLSVTVGDSSNAQFIYPFAAAAFGSSCVAAVIRAERFAQRLPSLSNFAGATSYGVYLYHLLPLYLLSKFDLPVGLMLLLFSGATCGLAAASAYGFERQILSMRPSYAGRTPTPLPVPRTP